MSLLQRIVGRSQEAFAPPIDDETKKLLDELCKEHAGARYSFDPLDMSRSGKQILALSGDPQRGRELFLRGNGIQCRNCHQLEEIGKAIGPDLRQIGKKYDMAKLLESMLEPSKTIDPKFTSYLIETRKGRVHSGLLVRKSDKEVVLKTTEGKELRVAANDIELMVPQRKSMMPDLLLRDLTAQQVADLIAYLRQLDGVSAASLGAIFADGFESGDTTRW